MRASKKMLLRLAEMGKLRRGAMRMSLTTASRSNPKTLIVTISGQEVGWVPYHAQYRSDTDNAILEAIDSTQQGR